MIKSFPTRRVVAAVLTIFIAPICSAAAATDPAPVPGFTHVRTEEDISEYRLDANGLTVLLLPDHSAPRLL